jgi:hypothetical protein
MEKLTYEQELRKECISIAVTLTAATIQANPYCHVVLNNAADAIYDYIINGTPEDEPEPKS